VEAKEGRKHRERVEFGPKARLNSKGEAGTDIGLSYPEKGKGLFASEQHQSRFRRFVDREGWDEKKIFSRSKEKQTGTEPFIVSASKGSVPLNVRAE